MASEPSTMFEEFAIKWMQICRPYNIGPSVATPESLIERIGGAELAAARQRIVEMNLEIEGLWFKVRTTSYELDASQALLAEMREALEALLIGRRNVRRYLGEEELQALENAEAVLAKFPADAVVKSLWCQHCGKPVSSVECDNCRKVLSTDALAAHDEEVRREIWNAAADFAEGWDLASERADKELANELRRRAGEKP